MFTRILLALLLAAPASASYSGYVDGYGCSYTEQSAYGSFATAAAEPANQLADSWDYNDAYWGGSTADVSIVVSQPDPFATTQAYWFINVGTSSQFWQEVSSGFTLDVGTYVVSAYYKLGGNGDMMDGNLRLNNSTQAQIALSSYIWTSGVLSYGGSSIGGAGQSYCTGGVIDIGDGWYRAYVAVDMAAAGWLSTDTIDVRMMLWGGDASSSKSLYATGTQLEPGLTPGAYLEKP